MELLLLLSCALCKSRWLQSLGSKSMRFAGSQYRSVGLVADWPTFW